MSAQIGVRNVGRIDKIEVDRSFVCPKCGQDGVILAINRLQWGGDLIVVCKCRYQVTVTSTGLYSLVQPMTHFSVV